MSIEAVGAIEAPNPTASPVVPEAITEPVAKASRQAYEHVAGKFEWYREQWEDVVHEAKAVRAQKYSLEGVSVADVLSGLGGAKVASSLPGRARLRLKQLRKQDQLAEQTAHALGALPGITQAEANPLTGSVLILFDAKKYPSLDALLKAVAGDQQAAEVVAPEEITVPAEVQGTAEA